MKVTKPAVQFIIIVNNQIGFTTNTDESRSTTYSTDIAKMIQAPILHVNGNNPEAVSWVADFAFKYRQQFNSDVVIDLLCYRKYGHNEADEPTYTQPLLYKKIRAMEPISKVYSKQLEQAKIIQEKEYDEIHKSVLNELETEFEKYKAIEKKFTFNGFYENKEKKFTAERCPNSCQRRNIKKYYGKNLLNIEKIQFESKSENAFG